jgi:hypothetical protein
MEFSLHPKVFQTGEHDGLKRMLESIWVKDHDSGNGFFYIISAFSNYNGGARFYNIFQEHIERGGKIVAILAGSTSHRISSKQVVEALLECGVNVYIVNRKRLLHAKCYGVKTSEGQKLIVTSGNFTAPGMSQNIEAALLMENEDVDKMGFDWTNLNKNIFKQGWLIYQPKLKDIEEPNNPAWQLLYDETPSDTVPIPDDEKITMLVLLGHSDTARIQAQKGTDQAKGSQYFWLSKDSFDFFPPLTIRNKRGFKSTLSALIKLNYVDLGIIDTKTRITFEAQNNQDFRLGTGKLRYTKMANDGDIAALSRISEESYELRIINKGSNEFKTLQKYAVSYIGHKGKRYGYIDNEKLGEVIEEKIK